MSARTQAKPRTCPQVSGYGTKNMEPIEAQDVKGPFTSARVPKSSPRFQVYSMPCLWRGFLLSIRGRRRLCGRPPFNPEPVLYLRSGVMRRQTQEAGISRGLWGGAIRSVVKTCSSFQTALDRRLENFRILVLSTTATPISS